MRTTTASAIAGSQRLACRSQGWTTARGDLAATIAFRLTCGVCSSLVLRVSRYQILETDIRKAEPEHALVMLAGELDTSNVAELYEELAELVREGVRHIAINLSELEFVDSTGLSAFITAHKRAESLGGELILFSPSQDLRLLFERTGIDGYLNIRESAPGT
jgi:anti-anti-sigma factor